MEIKKAKEMTSDFSGAYGFVIKPDEKTQTYAKKLARTAAPWAEFLVEVPHITLYHAQFENLPEELAKSILDDVKGAEGQILNLRRLYIFGGKFIFWDVEDKDSIRLIHEKALASAKYLNHSVAAKSIEEGLDLNPEEIANIQKFGHPLVMDKFTPHITLAYDHQGIFLPPGIAGKNLEMKIDKVSFAEMGKYGSVSKIIDL